MYLGGRMAPLNAPQNTQEGTSDLHTRPPYWLKKSALFGGYLSQVWFSLCDGDVVTIIAVRFNQKAVDGIEHGVVIESHVAFEFF